MTTKQAVITEENNLALEELKNKLQQKNTDIVPVELDESEKQEISQTFENVKDFRTLGEKITAPIDNVIEKTSKIIESDPIMDVSGELKKVNEEIQSVYKEIIDNDSAFTRFLKKIPVLGSFVKKVDDAIDDFKFDMKSIQWKIEVIFSGFDQSYKSLNKSIQMQQEFLEWLDANIWKVKAYKKYVEQKLKEFKGKYENVNDPEQKEKYEMFIRNVEFFLRNLETLIWNLELARKRLLVRLDSAVKLSLAMSGSRPIFKTLLSVAILETAGQKAIDASAKSIEAMWNTIDKLSSDLTDKVIQSSKKTEEITSKPVLDGKVFVENVRKLKEHFEQIEQYREQVKKEAEEERKLFEQATKELENMKTGKSEDFNELKEELVQK